MDECEIWPGLLAEVNPGYFYGHTNAKQRRATGERYAHRHVWAEAHGPIPKGVNICHECDNPPCVRLSHLFSGTHGDNMRDMAAKGRHNSHLYPELRRGERSASAVLSEAQARDIRKRVAGGPKPRGFMIRLAREFGVSDSTIADIRAGRTWKHVV